jgi:uncharacterized membrane protein
MNTFKKIIIALFFTVVFIVFLPVISLIGLLLIIFMFYAIIAEFLSAPLDETTEKLKEADKKINDVIKKV